MLLHTFYLWAQLHAWNQSPKAWPKSSQSIFLQGRVQIPLTEHTIPCPICLTTLHNLSKYVTKTSPHCFKKKRRPHKGFPYFLRYYRQALMIFLGDFRVAPKKTSTLLWPKIKILWFPGMRMTRKIFTRAAADLFF